MTSKTVDINDTQTSLSELVHLVQDGNEVILAEADKPVARLIAIPSPKRTRVPGLHRGAIWTSEDFDEPLPDSFWSGAN